MEYELVEMDPVTGKEDQLLSPRPGTYRECKIHMDEVMADMEAEWNEGSTAWSWLRIQPARPNPLVDGGCNPASPVL